MTLQSYVSRLDDYSGELAMNLATLERDLHAGKKDMSSVVTFLGQVQAVAWQVDIRPWRQRGIGTAVAATLFLALWEALLYVFPEAGENLAMGVSLLPFMAFLAYLLAAFYFSEYYRRSRNERAWFKGLEETVRSGGNIADYLA